MTNPSYHIEALRIRVRGLVQGVGFRPFVYRTACNHHLAGWVANCTDGVEILVEGPSASLSLFLESLRRDAPVVAQIDEILTEQGEVKGLQSFRISESRDLTDETSEISPDISVCRDCLLDMKAQPHRINYPFINCTNCGPRFSIVRDFPYDRSKTTMDRFQMCADCRREFEDINDRRFHAQPVACNHCGPVYSLHQGSHVTEDLRLILEQVTSLIADGRIIAVKGTGGYHMLCDAQDEAAVSRLRQAKRREGKPFAVMFRDLDTIRAMAYVGQAEEQALLSWQRPIVILKMRKELAQGVSMGLDTVGAFLPYMPFHYLLFEHSRADALVLTSGNVAGEPIVIDDEEALTVLAGISDAVLIYNREIHNRSDDSVLLAVGNEMRMIRRSRGYVPSPLRVKLDVNGILAAGAELVNCFCIGKGNRAYLSQHIGDLKNAGTFAFYSETVDRFTKIFRIKPQIAAADMHPDYLSTRFATQLGIDVKEVQHHHAHIASCMAENGLDEPVIGLAFDGTGYGTDGHIWGSEFLVCDLEDFERYGHFEYMPMPGGDKATEEVWRMGVSLLYMAYGSHFTALDLPLLREIGGDKLSRISVAIEKKINSPLTSGAGRLFDAVAAITGLCFHTLHHAEAPMRLEAAIDERCLEAYEIPAGNNISFIPVIRQICDDMANGIPPGIVSAKFHNAVVEVSLEMARRISRETGLDKVVLSGGTFQNRYLSERLENRLKKDHLRVYTHRHVPCNDGGIALGQLAVAARMRQNGK